MEGVTTETPAIRTIRGVYGPILADFRTKPGSRNAVLRPSGIILAPRAWRFSRGFAKWRKFAKLRNPHPIFTNPKNAYVAEAREA